MIKKRIATFTILLVSASAFIAGYYQNTVADDANDFFEESELSQTNAIRIEQEAKRMYDYDLIQDQRAQDMYEEAWQEAQQIVILEDDLTANELYARQYDVYAKIFYGYTLFFESNAWIITESFIAFPEETFEIANVNIDGYEFIILPGEYEDNIPVDVFTIDEFLGDEGWNFPTDIIDFIKIFDPTLDLFGEINFFNLNILLSNQLWWEQSQVVKKREIGNDLLSQANSLTQSVSITTVAVILATSMSNRLNEKEQEANFDTIIENVSDHRYEVKVKDNLSVPVLAAAILLSVAGLLFAL